MSVFDVAEYILARVQESSAIKLQKLVYYTQAWNLVAYDEPLFSEPIIAHRFGPLCTTLWERHRGSKTVSAGDFGPFVSGTLTHEQTQVIDSVLSFYGGLSMTAIVDRTHGEDPWKDAYVRGEEITIPAIHSFYVCQLMSGAVVPELPGSTVTYIADEHFDDVISDDDEPDDYSGFLLALTKAGA